LTQPLRDRLEQAHSVLGIRTAQQIFVRLIDGKCRSVLSDLSHTVKTFLALTIAEHFPVPPAFPFYAVSQGRILKPELTLEDQGIAKGCTVHICVGSGRALL
jgi:hypothetical protein